MADTPGTSTTLQRYVDLLTSVGVERGLIGPREVDRIWSRHIDNSLALAGLLAEGSDVVDVGSGAGLPGVPLAIARPDLRMTLLEPLLRRATFLSEAAAALDLPDRVRVVRARAENHRQTYDVVVARAVAPLGRLVGWCEPLLAPDGVLLALKGLTSEAEIDDSRRELDRARLRADVLEVRARADAEPTRVVRVRRTGRR